MTDDERDFDVVVIGAGPVGCAAALAHARRGARVLLLEANPRAADRLAGEWLHPLGVALLEDLGVELRGEQRLDSGRGFVVFPEDESAPITLPYADLGKGVPGWSGEHRALVARLRRHAADHAAIRYRDDARVSAIDEHRVTYQCGRSGSSVQVRGARVIGADGRASRARHALGLAPSITSVSRMAGLRLGGVELPREGYGHVFLGGPGPILMYRIDEQSVRLCVDVPFRLAADAATLWDAYAHFVPLALRPALRRELCDGNIEWAVNQSRARDGHGREPIFLVGDAVGCSHPLTAVGMTLGLADAVTLADHDALVPWRRARRRDGRVAELLAHVLHEVFVGDGDALIAMRQAIHENWRRHPGERVRTMRYISAEPGQLAAFSSTFARVTGRALGRLAIASLAAGEPARATAAMRELSARARWLASAALFQDGAVAPEPTPLRSQPPKLGSAIAGPAIVRAVDRLRALQGDRPGLPKGGDRERSGESASTAGSGGGWEGEVVWCPMLAAQYVIFCQVMEIPIDETRRAGLLKHFGDTRHVSGSWGLHALSPPYLFVTTLVYVAARLLGVAADDALLARAGRFIRREDVTRIPSWGKLWLALAGLYDWRGVPPMVPELWALPRSLPVHPSKFYCHTRQIHLAMSVLYARRLRAESSPRLERIRDELYRFGPADVDWTKARRALRREDLVAPPGLLLRAAYEFGARFERLHPRGLRARVLDELDERIRFELRSTHHTSLSPVSGLLNILALHAGHPDDPEIKPAIDRLEGSIWHDEQAGTRIAGARSASWDTAFALQALAAAKPHADVEATVARGAAFLRAQQIRLRGPSLWDEFRQAYRADPDGGWCFAGAWHGWPVSDCTAEAMEALLSNSDEPPDDDAMRAGARFILGCQNPDGGFGSYEGRRSRFDLEWLNPAEMFTDSMSEHSYVECTASCIAALSRHLGQLRRFRGRAGDDVVDGDVDGEADGAVDEAVDGEAQIVSAIERAVSNLRSLQRPDGAWPGVWGVHLVYGTYFAVRGLVSAGVPPGDPALVRARRWLVARQRSDGGWGESHAGCLDGRYTASTSSQVIQTAWAMLALLEACETDWSCLVRGARFLIERQDDDGAWPRQDPVGLFFRTALLDYTLYRQYFPLQALSLYESRRIERDGFARPHAAQRGTSS